MGENTASMDWLPGFLLFGTLILLVSPSFAASTEENTEDQDKAIPARFMTSKRLALGAKNIRAKRFFFERPSPEIKALRAERTREENDIYYRTVLHYECCEEESYGYCSQEEITEKGYKIGNQQWKSHQWACEFIKEDSTCKEKIKFKPESAQHRKDAGNC